MTRSKMRAERMTGRFMSDHCVSCEHQCGGCLDAKVYSGYVRIHCVYYDEPAEGRVYRKRGKSVPKCHKGVNNTKKMHHDLMDAVAPPKAQHCYQTYNKAYTRDWW